MDQTRYHEKLDDGSSHDLLGKWFRDQPAGIRILDVGAATGTLGKMLANKGYEIYGVEPNRTWAEMAKVFYKDIYVGTLEETPDDFITNFDVVVFADVLEHLPDPLTQLSRVIQLQKTGAIFLICVPNVANLWIRMQLLVGKFEYTERGILDRTHLRFFTYSSFVRMINSCGLAYQKIIPTPVPVSLVAPTLFQSNRGSLIKRSLYHLTGWFPRLLGYQFFAICRR
jgi:2-polyprenyl-3-methyl-5-hydroxy-6-metoxy-1,4-benzoquinol methylase